MAVNDGVLLDAGPLVAYLAEDERHHGWATQQFSRVTGRAVTCEAVLSESWFLLRRWPRHLARLRALLVDGVLDLTFHLETEAAAVGRLLERYREVPISLADACLVRLSELHPRLPLLTLDAHFHIYRRNRRQVIPVISPG